MSNIPSSIRPSDDSPQTSPTLAHAPEGVHAAVQAHLEQQGHTTRCGPLGEAQYDHWDPNDHLKHKQPHVSTETKLNAVDAMEMPHADQCVDLVNR
ncbi:uncharacterized protein JCM6883_004525 [Sporobolomyces salmoneus]|uniref:uncharacterized protein n=1 Tax=Sporobolomyces salmoneus TaxID=183962 RepID=UPI00316BA5ED